MEYALKETKSTNVIYLARVVNTNFKTHTLSLARTNALYSHAHTHTNREQFQV